MSDSDRQTERERERERERDLHAAQHSIKQDNYDSEKIGIDRKPLLVFPPINHSIYHLLFRFNHSVAKQSCQDQQ